MKIYKNKFVWRWSKKMSLFQPLDVTSAFQNEQHRLRESVKITRRSIIHRRRSWSRSCQNANWSGTKKKGIWINRWKSAECRWRHTRRKLARKRTILLSLLHACLLMQNQLHYIFIRLALRRWRTGDSAATVSEVKRVCNEKILTAFVWFKKGRQKRHPFVSGALYFIFFFKFVRLFLLKNICPGRHRRTKEKASESLSSLEWKEKHLYVLS